MTYPSDFKSPKSIKTITQIFESNEFPFGYMLDGQKWKYSESFPNHLVIFNANVLTKSHGKVWYGDLDVSISHARLKKIAEQVGEPLYVLHESAARFGEENKPVKRLLAQAVWDTTQDVIFLNEYREARDAARSK
tara:strand:+ start:4135 stop:4539 length:405 start_codon:yes stop_codon:yes gene_type:complete